MQYKGDNKGSNNGTIRNIKRISYGLDYYTTVADIIYTDHIPRKLITN